MLSNVFPSNGSGSGSGDDNDNVNVNINGNDNANDSGTLLVRAPSRGRGIDVPATPMTTPN